MPQPTQGVFITGAGSGLGKEMALAFAARGDRVAVTGTSGIRETAELIRGRGGLAVDIPLDVSSQEQVEQAAARAIQELGRVDILVNNAGIAGPTLPVCQISPPDWEQTLAVNLTGAFLCDRALAPHMMARRSGCIIHISSVAGLHAYPLRAPYAASKWGLHGLNATLAAELGPYNIRVNAICPGPVAGDRMRRVISHRAETEGRSFEEVQEEFVQRTVLGRMVDPEDVVELVLFLASDGARNITGQTIRVCAGYRL